jgi:hypothetical protein
VTGIRSLNRCKDVAQPWSPAHTPESSRHRQPLVATLTKHHSKSALECLAGCGSWAAAVRPLAWSAPSEGEGIHLTPLAIIGAESKTSCGGYWILQDEGHGDAAMWLV